MSNPFGIKEVAEQSGKQYEIGNKTKALENASKEVKEKTHIKTLNENLEGKRHPDTGVEYRKRTVTIDGQKIEGVFPVFESKMDLRLPKNLWKASDDAQMRCCTEQLAKRIEADPDFAKNFTPRQLEQIKNGEPHISGLTWHHNERPGVMQLVDADVHNRSAHTGGKSLWGGGR